MQRSLQWFAIAATLALAHTALAMPDGISGYSGLTPNNTCVACHPGGNPPTVTLDGPTTLAAGATGEYTFTLKTAKLFGGLDVAVDNPGARLQAVSPMTRLLGGEVTHSQPLAVANGEIVVKLSMTAPSTAGTVTLYADGQADNKPQIADSSAAPVQLKVTVTGGGTGGNGATNGAGGVDGGTNAAAPMHGCAFAATAPANRSLAPIGFGLLLGFVIAARRRRRD